MPEKKITSYPKEKINILFLENINKTAVQKFIDAGYTSVKRLSGAITGHRMFLYWHQPGGPE